MNNAPETTFSHLNDCGCCEGTTVKTPIEIDNRPSLQVIAYRIGEYADFKATLLTRLSSADFSSLKNLRTRNDNDFSIALLDAWSIVADVLTFYDQYYANEHYLRTATERMSILELARLIGYQPHPGVAASTLLAFTMDEIPGSPEKITLSAGTKVQSTPKQDEQAQIFETIEEIEARPAWNSIKPRLTQPQIPVSSTTELVFDGINTGLKSGDGVLFTPVGGNGKNVFATISSVELDQAGIRTRVQLTALKDPSVHGAIATVNLITEGLPPPAGNYLGKTLETEDLEAEAKVHNFKIQDIFDALSANDSSGHFAIVFRQQASIFGHNAPAWDSLSESLKGNISVFSNEPGPFKYDKYVWPGGDLSNLAKMNQDVCPKGQRPASESNVQGIVAVHFNSSSEVKDNPIANSISFDGPKGNEDHEDFEIKNRILVTWLFLDNVYKEIRLNSQIILKDVNIWGLYDIKSVTELTKSCFTITSKITRLGLDSSDEFGQFSIRCTSVYLQSESLPLARVPIENPVPMGNSQTLELNGFINGLYEGQQVVLSGLEIGGTENLISESITLEKVEHELILGGSTHITFSPALKHVYKRETVSINANIAAATHGETVQEVLGSGDATQPYQTFTLKQPPLTNISATTPSGEESTLAVRVNDVLWHETSSLLKHGPEDRVFVTRNNDADETIIEFGNGDMGARLPTGQDNVRAVYRQGIGTEGLVDTGQLNMLMSRPLGLKEVVNPHESTGAADPESYDDAQRNAPLTVLTLDRAVSLRDYEDFSRAFAGIAKALAISVLGGQEKIIFITVAGPNGVPVNADSEVYKNLLVALAGSGDPLARFRVRSYRSATFRFRGKVKIDSDFTADKVLEKVELALRAAFSFDRRAFGQPVALSEVIAVIQAIPGVVAVDVDSLYRGNIPKLEPLILAQPPVKKSNGQLQAAELLTLHPSPLDLLEMVV